MRVLFKTKPENQRKKRISVKNSYDFELETQQKSPKRRQNPVTKKKTRSLDQKLYKQNQLFFFLKDIDMLRRKTDRDFSL